MATNNKSYLVGNDSSPGYIYLMEALGYHGLVPGCYLRRCKIGLSRNPQARLDNFHSNQPPCDIKIVKTVFVNDMVTVEAELHQLFKNYQVKLERSREWFDLNPLQYHRVLWVMNRYETHQLTFKSIPLQAVVSGLITLFSVGIFIGQGMSEKPAIHQPSKVHQSK